MLQHLKLFRISKKSKKKKIDNVKVKKYIYIKSLRTQEISLEKQNRIIKKKNSERWNFMKASTTPL